MTKPTKLLRNIRYILQTNRSRCYTMLLRVRYHFSFTRRERLGFRSMLLILFVSIAIRTWGLVRPAKDWDIVEETIHRNSTIIEQKIAGTLTTGTPINRERQGKSEQQPHHGEKDGKESPPRYQPPSYMVKRDVFFDLNQADTFDLDELKGIGPTYARRIVAYREKLGGFTHVDQLREVWGIDSMLLERIRPYIYVEKVELRKLNINSASIKQMRNHPYLDYYQAKEIFLHRQKYGRFRNIEQMRYVNLIDSGTYARIRPYVSIDTITDTLSAEQHRHKPNT